jgi:hypothetical protein
MPSCRGIGGRRSASAPLRVVRISACVVLLLLASAVASARQREAAGRIKIASGAVFIVRADDTMPAKAGLDVYEADTLRTGADGSVGITLKDDTRLSLGPNSEIRLDRFAFAPAEGKLGFVLKVVRGVAAYVSGRIAKIAPDAVRLETPSAIVGVRGTTVVMRAGQTKK